ncbi:N-acetyl sugar amidotransferase [Ekhidna sp.]|uniref:N-acetyl sugar amidotransferase n=1 Tax=Ekhidna sp. TaxID=2608089 RepID=UPI003B50EB01
MKQCVNCVMDTTTNDISFDEQGVCSYCRSFEKISKKTIYRSDEVKKAELDQKVALIKKIGTGKKYDCVLGLSGGVDSTYLAYLAHSLGLRPLCVHFDNGWNTEIAVQNIHNIVNKLGFDLHTFVMDWEEFKNIQLAYFKASVLDLEVPTDQFIFAALFKTAAKRGIKTILSGNNIATEFVLPLDWRYQKFDLVNLYKIHSRFGNGKLKKLPKLGSKQRHWYEVAHQIRLIPILDLVPYKKLEVKELIQDKVDWKDYGGKHYESIFTRWYQGVYLPEKFNIDKRKAHLSNLIVNGEINKSQAIEELNLPTYDPKLQKSDVEYVIKKWGLTEEEYHVIMKMNPVDHQEYGTQFSLFHKAMFHLFRLLTYLPIRIGRLMRILPKPLI